MRHSSRVQAPQQKVPRDPTKTLPAATKTPCSKVNKRGDTFKMSSAGSDKEKSSVFGFYSYITNDYVNVEALSDTHPSSHGFHQGAWLSSAELGPSYQGITGCSQVLARAQAHQRLELEKSPFRAPSGWWQNSRPCSITGRWSGTAFSFLRLASASCHVSPLAGSLPGSSSLVPGRWEHLSFPSSESRITKAKPGSGVCRVK